MLELCHQLLPQLVINHGHLETALIGQEVTIVRGLEMKLQILQSLALNQVQIIILKQNTFNTKRLFFKYFIIQLLTILETPAQTLQVSIINIEHVTLHNEVFFCSVKY